MIGIIKLVISGIIIGVANIIPGVSGGTMAVILNIFDKLILSISEFRKRPIESIKFLAPIGVGGILGIGIFSVLIKFLLREYNLQVNYFFIGLIFGSIPLIYKRAGGIKDKVFLKSIAFLVAMIAIILISVANKTGNNSILEISATTMVKLFIDSMIGAAAMILPGVSGSLVLVILGSYFTIINAIPSLNMYVLIPVAIGVLIGILFGSKILAISLKKSAEITFAAILGLIFGSMLILISNNILSLDINGLVSIITLAAGILIALWFSKKA